MHSSRVPPEGQSEERNEAFKILQSVFPVPHVPMIKLGPAVFMFLLGLSIVSRQTAVSLISHVSVSTFLASLSSSMNQFWYLLK